MFSGVIAWFYKALLGIAPTEEHPAFEELTLSPCFLADVGFVRGRMETVKGIVEAEWHTENGGFLYRVTIPKGIRATFRGKELRVGRNEFLIKQEEEAIC
jgi:hypothetical protein